MCRTHSQPNEYGKKDRKAINSTPDENNRINLHLRRAWSSGKRGVRQGHPDAVLGWAALRQRRGRSGFAVGLGMQLAAKRSSDHSLRSNIRRPRSVGRSAGIRGGGGGSRRGRKIMMMVMVPRGRRRRMRRRRGRGCDVHGWFLSRYLYSFKCGAMRAPAARRCLGLRRSQCGVGLATGISSCKAGQIAIACVGVETIRRRAKKGDDDGAVGQLARQRQRNPCHCCWR